MRPLLLLMRHGETDLNKAKEFRGWDNPPLNKDGLREAGEAKSFLRKYPISLTVHSDLKRTTQMAEAVGIKPMEADFRLRPLNVGVFAGEKKTPAVTKMFDYYLLHPDRKIPQGESIHDFEERYEPVLRAALEYGETGHLVLLSVHTSNVVAAQNLLEKEDIKVEKGNLLKPGGVAGVFKQGNKYIVKALFKPETGREASDQVW